MMKIARQDFIKQLQYDQTLRNKCWDIVEALFEDDNDPLLQRVRTLRNQEGETIPHPEPITQ